MKLTKYQHACFSLEQDNQLLVVDPGNWSTDFIVTNNIVAVFISHEHGDHFDTNLISAIFDKNPNVLIISDQDILNQISLATAKKPVVAGDTLGIGPFSLEFFGGQHATIRPSLPPIANLGVMINNLVYYPGDSFVAPNKPVDTLLLPISAPWLKFSETTEFLSTIEPRLACPTHDAILSSEGVGLYDRMIMEVAEQVNTKYRRITGTSIQI